MQSMPGALQVRLRSACRGAGQAVVQAGFVCNYVAPGLLSPRVGKACLGGQPACALKARVKCSRCLVHYTPRGGRKVCQGDRPPVGIVFVLGAVPGALKNWSGRPPAGGKVAAARGRCVGMVLCYSAWLAWGSSWAPLVPYACVCAQSSVGSDCMVPLPGLAINGVLSCVRWLVRATSR